MAAQNGHDDGADVDVDTEFTPSDDNTPERGSRAAGVTAKAITLGAKLIPKQSVLFRKLALNSIKQYHKRAGGDALAIDAKAGQQLDLTPVRYRAAGECEEGEKPGWVAKDGTKTWNAASEGRVVDYLNNTPIVALDRDSHVECGWLRPRIAEAVELDQYGPVYTNPQLQLVADATQSNGQAVADGGTPELELGSPGQWAGDALVDLGSGDGYDGMRVSFRKATEWMAEQTTTQEMQMQEDRGYIRGLAGGDRPSLTKLLLICAAIILGSFLIAFVGPEIAGGGGGGGGINPLMIDTLATLTA